MDRTRQTEEEFETSEISLTYRRRENAEDIRQRGWGVTRAHSRHGSSLTERSQLIDANAFVVWSVGTMPPPAV